MIGILTLRRGAARCWGFTPQHATGGNVAIRYLAETTHGFTGADVAALCREAAMAAVRDQITETVLRDLDTPIAIRAAHFARVF